ncbi:ATP synthase F1 subcomplex delta subunit [Pseudoroseicyclus aestuarii]|uniref:ATP synthase subunit delta n=1 Tax=Pseudoroseicyclus aestuarii TaxID=1795041 RepID=A0A318SNY6_9RHOB|nr:ATP synthase F1 subcomplex delta subunit [Pseudoroseicyclus aestuarii]
MSESASISTGIAGRYASAAFDLAREGDGLDRLSSDTEALEAALNDSADLRDLINSPIYARGEQRDGVLAVARKMDLSQTMVGLLGVMAEKRRLFVLPQLIRALKERLAEERGEVTADVTSAKPLTETQTQELSAALKAQAGRDVRLHQMVDEGLIGGLVVKLGSKMIDTSIRSKLQSLQNVMKEAR